MQRFNAGVVLSLGLGLLSTSCKEKSKPRAPDAPAVAASMDARISDGAPIDARVVPVTAARVEHPVWNLVDNRAMAHRTVDGDLVISASDAGFVRYAGFGLPV
ncbi:MAG: hypothetical protein KBG15_13940, partial [Kofleriaceae bacterium]|nr:hypothetical protein [Kofleriaceae bacterium]